MTTYTLSDGPLGLPLELLLGSAGVGSSSLRVVDGHVLVDDADSLGKRVSLLLLDLLDNVLVCQPVFSLDAVSTHSDSLGKLEDGELVGRTNVDGSGLVTVHEEDQTIDQIVNVLEGSGLVSVTVDGHVLTLEGLDDEVGNDSTIVRVHSGTESVEDSGNPNLDVVLSHVTVGKGLGDSLTLIVTSSGTDTVDVTPVVLSLRVLLWVTVDLGGRGDEESSLGSLGKTKHVQGTHERSLDGLNGVVLVVRGRGGTGKVVDFCPQQVIPTFWGDDSRSTSMRKGSTTSCRTISKLGWPTQCETVVREPVKKLSRTVTS